MSDQQLYKLKQEAKPFHSSHYHDKKERLTYWNREEIIKNALEPVEPEKIRVLFYGKSYIRKSIPDSAPDWTEQERQDVERLLNLGGFKGLNLLADEWNNFKALSGQEHIDFIVWLKEQGL